MTAFNRTPQNTNYLQQSKFILTFDRIGTTQYFCQTVNIPGINLGATQVNTPTLDINVPSTKLTYNPFNIRFNVDEKLDSWQQLHRWFRSIASPEGFEERKRLSELQNQYKAQAYKNYSDATLTVLNNLNNPTLRVHFYNVFPTSLSDITFDTTSSADDIVTADASFNFDYFDFETV
jgi:hypothetical protein